MPGRILIADDTISNRMLLRACLSEAQYRVATVSSEAELLDTMREGTTNIAILGEEISGRPGPALCRKIKSDPALRSAAVIQMTRAGDAGTGIEALEAGADEFLTRPLVPMILLARVRSILRTFGTHEAIYRRRATAAELGFAEPAAAFSGPAHLGLVGASAEETRGWITGIGPRSGHRISHLDPESAVELAEGRDAPDVYVVDGHLQEKGGGLRLICDLRTRAASRHSGLVLRHPVEDVQLAALALDLGANDIVSSNCTEAEFRVRLTAQLRRKNDADRLRDSVEDGLRLAMRDHLTGLYNRRYATPHLARMLADAHESGSQVAVMIADIDEFKSINDRYGHPVGDAVIAEVARRLRDNMRDVDLVARIGGEEFLIAMPDTDRHHALIAADRLRQKIAVAPVSRSQEGAIRVTVSIGIALSAGELPEEPLDRLLTRADRALYTAKSDGRNQVTLAQSAA